VNKVLIVGRLTHDPEKNTTSSGISYVRFSVAVNRSFNKEQTDFIPVVA
jgi:single-strand DNA-binding protein